jgi:hypothetical protein
MARVVSGVIQHYFLMAWGCMRLRFIRLSAHDFLIGDGETIE